jgi:Protein of unknown function (DUF4232)
MWSGCRRRNVALVGLVLIVAACGPVPVANVGPATAATPMARATEPSTAGMCRAVELRASVTDWEGNTGTPVAHVTLTNASRATCVVRGTAQAQIVDATGGIVGEATAGTASVSTADPAISLAPGTTLTTTVQWGNWCTSLPPAQPVTVSFVLPLGLGRVVAAAAGNAPVPDCAMEAESPPVVTSTAWSR